MNIVLHIKGGLGNQMFEYAMARALQLKYPKSKLFIDISEIMDDSQRTFGLGAFKLIENVSLIRDANQFRYKKNKSVWRRRLWDYCPKIAFYFMFYKEGILWWDDLSYIKIPAIKRDTYLNGYWQSEKFFLKYISQIKEEFKFLHPVKDYNKITLKKIKESESCCVHVRLGDYYEIGNEDYQICTPEYFCNCIKELIEEKENLHFFVFSDEIQKTKDIFDEIDANITYLEGNNNDYEDLQLMIACKHFIISNSTFSWWAQYLSDNPRKIVYAPRKWMNSGKNKDVYLKTWRLR